MPGPRAIAAHRLGHAGYFAELLDEWAPDAAPNERLFRLGAAVGEALARGGSVEALARYFEVLAAAARRRVSRARRVPACGRQALSGGAVLVERRAGAWSASDCAHGGERLSSGAMAFLRAAATATPLEARLRADAARCVAGD